jgi:hypothetical protein
MHFGRGSLHIGMPYGGLCPLAANEIQVMSIPPRNAALRPPRAAPGKPAPSE